VDGRQPASSGRLRRSARGQGSVRRPASRAEPAILRGRPVAVGPPRAGTRLLAPSQQREEGRANHKSGGGLGGRGCRIRRGARNWLPYCRTIAAAGSSRIPTAPRSSTKVHSAAMRLTTSSGLILAPSKHHLETPVRPVISSLKRSLTADVQLWSVIPEIDIWRAAQLMLKWGISARRTGFRV
jgi:hypothetical protein